MFLVGPQDDMFLKNAMLFM